MKKILIMLLMSFVTLFAYGKQRMGQDTQIWDFHRITNIENYNNLGRLWTSLQGQYIATIALIAMICVLWAFALHYMIIGPKQFSHNGKKIYAFSLFERIFHFIAAISWVILVPTGFIMMFGSTFGGGVFVRVCKNLHVFATLTFIISIIPMFLYWIKRMIPTSYDLRWIMIFGGYLSKQKRPIPAGKFNFGQKSWYFVAVFGGFLMIITGGFMYFLDFNSKSLQLFLGLSHIELLRIAALIHNFLGIICAVFFAIHIYMAVFAIKGSIHSMVNGYKEEEEVYILHHYWYKELSNKKQINPSFDPNIKI